MTDAEMKLTVRNAQLEEECSNLRHTIVVLQAALDAQNAKTRGEGGFGSSGRN